MARRRIRLSQFVLEGDSFDARTDLVHRYRQCDWSVNADGVALPALIPVAREHARKCDGKPQPRPPAQSSVLDPVIVGLWSKTLAMQLSAAQTGVRGA